MQVVETLSEGLKREFAVTLAAADLAARVDAKLAEIGRTAKLPGFRPGKIPLPVLKQRYGQSVMSEVLEEAVNTSSMQAIEERGLKPAMMPQVEITKFEPDGDLDYKMSVELLPEIEPMDFSTLSLERLTAEPSDAAIAQALQSFADSREGSEPLAEPRPAQLGDVVVLDFTGSVDGAEFEGGKAEDFHLKLGSNLLIPGFEEQLVGAEAGSERTVTVTFPADYRVGGLAGKPADFACRIKEIREPAPKAVDDALAKELGLGSLEELTRLVRERMSAEYAAAGRARLKRTLLDQLAEAHAFEAPPGMVEAENQAIWRQVTQARERGEQDPELEGKSEEELREEFRRIADRRVRLGLLLSEVGRRNNITVGDDELRRAVMDEARRHPGQEREVVEYFRKNPQAMDGLRAPLFEEKVVDFILELATVAERSVTAEELMTAAEAA